MEQNKHTKQIPSTMNATHTPGPWKVEVWDYSHATPPRKELIVQDANLMLATVAWDEGKENPYTVKNETAQANARLIAAAPELLATLRQTTFALESVLMLAGASLQPAAVEELAKYIEQAKATLATVTP